MEIILTGMVSCVDAYHSLQDNAGFNSWGKFVWGNFIPFSSSFLLWNILHGKLPIEEALSRWCFLPSSCRVCCNGIDGLQHVFIECGFARAV